MAIGIFIGNTIENQRVRYWTTRYISALSVLTTGETTQTITPTIVGTGQEGVSFEYSTDLGLNWTVKGTANGTFNATGLTANTLYLWRARLYKGSSYSAYSLTAFDWTFNLSDADGNTYSFVRILGQVWMVENLKTTKYNDGSAITRVTDNTAWKNLTTEAYDWYAGNVANKPLYGALYNGYSIDSGKLAPLKWLIPCKGDFNRLIMGQGGFAVAGSKLKEVGTTRWNNNTDATNLSGFTGVGGGFRNGTTGVFSLIKDSGFINGTTLSGSDLFASGLQGQYPAASALTAYSKKFGFSIRCILDTFWGDGVLYDGDSITVGYGASDNAHRWTTLLSAAKYVTETNNAISGTCLQNTVPTNPAGPVAVNFRDRVSAYPTRVASQRKSICLAYGINDIGMNFPSYTVDTFKNDYREVLTILNGKGWEKRQILLISPYYATSVGFAAYTYWGVTTPADETRLKAHVDAVQEIAVEFQCQFVNVYQYMKDNGAELLLSEDGLHLNDAGYALVANYIATMVI